MAVSCCGSAVKWKDEAEFVLERSFDDLDIEEYDQGSAWLRFKYIFVYLAVFRSCLIYLSDVAAVVFLFYPLQVDTIGTSFSPPAVAGLEFLKWMYLFCLVMAIVLLAIDIRKAKRIVESRDISLAFTSTIAYRYYSIQWYPYYCFFAEVRTMTKLKDNIALFVFFRLRGWKRLLLVEAPRNMISIFTLYFAYKRIFEKGNSANLIATVGLALITMSTAFFVFSALTTVIALYMYLPLVMDVQGNLKEYVCHKINKRITEMLEEQHARKEMLTRIQRAQTGVVEPMPTLPAVTTDTVKRSVKNVRRGTILSDHSSSTHGSSRASTAEANVVMSSSAPSMRTLDSGNSDRSSAASSLTAASYGSDVGRGGMLHGLASSHGARRTSPLTHAYEQEIRRGSLASSRDGSNNSGRQAVTRPAAALPAAPRPQYPPGYYRGYTQNDEFGPNSRR